MAIGALLALAVGFLLLRPWLGGYAIRTALGMTGATAIKFRTVEAVPSRVVVEDLAFRLKSQAFAARRLTLERPRWWRFSLGKVRVEGARLTFTVDGSDTSPWAWSTYEGAAEPVEPMSLPVESLELEGELLVRAAGLRDQRMHVKLAGAPQGVKDWVGTLTADGPGIQLAGGGTLLGWGTELDFQVHSAELDLKIWQGFIQRNLILPGGPWDMGGQLTGVAEGQVTAKRFAATARVSLRDGRMKARAHDIAAEGVEAEVVFSDLWKLRTKTGVLRLKELRVGRLPLSEVTADFGLWGAQSVTVNAAAFSTLGGRVEVGPFKYFLNQQEVAATLNLEDIDLARLLELTNGVVGKVTGRVDGSLPLRIHADGVRITLGYLALRGGGAELECNAATLLRSGATLSTESIATLKAAGTGLMRMKLREFRLDVRPPDVPLGTSARLRLAGETLTGPLSLDYNINGAIENYLRLQP